MLLRGGLLFAAALFSGFVAALPKVSAGSIERLEIPLQFLLGQTAKTAEVQAEKP